MEPYEEVANAIVLQAVKDYRNAELQQDRNRCNEIYRVQIPNITPHVSRHTYFRNMARAGMDPKTLQYLMGHSDIGETMNTYTHLELEDAQDEMIRMEKMNAERVEVSKTTGENPVTQKRFMVI